MKRKQFRYESEQEIVTAIDKALVLVRELLKASIEEDELADNARKSIVVIDERLNGWVESRERERMFLERATHANSLRIHRENALMMNKKRHRLENTRLVKLKAALAEFQTCLLPFTDDKGVVLRSITELNAISK